MPRRCKPVVSRLLHNVRACDTSFLVVSLFVGETEITAGVPHDADLAAGRVMVCFDLSWSLVQRAVRLSCPESSVLLVPSQ